MITIHLNAELDASCRGTRGIGRSRAAAGELQKLLTTHGLKPVPLFPAAPGPGGEGIWHAACPDSTAAEVVAKLLLIPGVAGAYVKPQEGLPDPP